MLARLGDLGGGHVGVAPPAGVDAGDPVQPVRLELVAEMLLHDALAADADAVRHLPQPDIDLAGAAVQRVPLFDQRLDAAVVPPLALHSLDPLALELLSLPRGSTGQIGSAHV